MIVINIKPYFVPNTFRLEQCSVKQQVFIDSCHVPCYAFNFLCFEKNNTESAQNSGRRIIMLTNKENSSTEGFHSLFESCEQVYTQIMRVLCLVLLIIRHIFRLALLDSIFIFCNREESTFPSINFAPFKGRVY